MILHRVRTSRRGIDRGRESERGQTCKQNGISWNRRKIWFWVLLEAILYLFHIVQIPFHLLCEMVLVSCMACFVIDFFRSLSVRISVSESFVRNSNQTENLLEFYNSNASHGKRFIWLKFNSRHFSIHCKRTVQFYLWYSAVYVFVCVCRKANSFSSSLFHRQQKFLCSCFLRTYLKSWQMGLSCDGFLFWALFYAAELVVCLLNRIRRALNTIMVDLLFGYVPENWNWFEQRREYAFFWSWLIFLALACASSHVNTLTSIHAYMSQTIWINKTQFICTRRSAFLMNRQN